MLAMPAHLYAIPNVQSILLLFKRDDTQGLAIFHKLTAGECLKWVFHWNQFRGESNKKLCRINHIDIGKKSIFLIESKWIAYSLKMSMVQWTFECTELKKYVIWAQTTKVISFGIVFFFVFSSVFFSGNWFLLLLKTSQRLFVCVRAHSIAYYTASL